MTGDKEAFFNTEKAITYRDIYNWAIKRLDNSYEARLIVEEVMQGVFTEEEELGKRYGVKYFLYSDRYVDTIAANKIEQMVTRRAQKEPLQHILGHYGFRYLDIKTDRRALVPRPETEILVEAALAELRNMAGDAGGNRKSEVIPHLTLLDIGTGSGVIGCSIAAECDDVDVVCLDISAEALDLAKENTGTLREEARNRVSLLRGNLADAIKDKTVDIICSNPPYLAAGELSTLDEEVRCYDPISALVGGQDGFEIIDQIISLAPELLKPGGSLVLEMAPRQARNAVSLAKSAGAHDISVIKDLAGRDRVLLARW